jgi:hypothetical protein
MRVPILQDLSTARKGVTTSFSAGLTGDGLVFRGFFDCPLAAHGISGSFGSRRKGSSTCAGHSLLSSLGRCGPLSVLPGPGISIFGCHFSRSLSPSFDENAWSLSSELDAMETLRCSSGEALLMKADVRIHRHEMAGSSSFGSCGGTSLAG